MSTVRRVAAYTVLGAIGGALAVITAGIGYVIADQQVAYRRAIKARYRAIHPIK